MAVKTTMIKFSLNNEAVAIDVAGNTPLLWVIRDHFKLKGSRFGCGMGLCGACSMHLDGESVRTCILPILAVAGRSVTTIEGLGTLIYMFYSRPGSPIAWLSAATASRDS